MTSKKIVQTLDKCTDVNEKISENGSEVDDGRSTDGDFQPDKQLKSIDSEHEFEVQIDEEDSDLDNYHVKRE